MIVGVLGGGQLARMLALAGIPLGMQFVFLDPAEDACAAPLGEHLCGAYDDEGLLRLLAEKSDLVTYEFENVPASAVAFLTSRVSVQPTVQALSVAGDRLNEKALCRELDIPTVSYRTVGSLHELQQAAEALGFPSVLKTRTLGYDGKGQVVLRKPSDLASAWNTLSGGKLILEGFAAFCRELSIICVRSQHGEIRYYPLSENSHQDGILRLARSCPNDPKQSQAQAYAARILNELEYVGVMAIEMFDMGDELWVNELAPRVHNSGHWTIEGAQTSQFENHLRAIAGLPLGSTAASGYATMVNFIGEIPRLDNVLAVPGVHLHHYNKKPIPGRKVGHATLWAPDHSPEYDTSGLSGLA